MRERGGGEERRREVGERGREEGRRQTNRKERDIYERQKIVVKERDI